MVWNDTNLTVFWIYDKKILKNTHAEQKEPMR